MINEILMQGSETCYKKEARLECSHKINLLYGLNGVGKSTLSNYLFTYPNTEERFVNCKLNTLHSDKILLVYNVTVKTPTPKKQNESNVKYMPWRKLWHEHFTQMKKKQKHITMWKESGLNRKEYAASNGINEGTFYKWLEMKHENPEAGTGKNFVEIRQDGVPIEETIKVR